METPLLRQNPLQLSGADPTSCNINFEQNWALLIGQARQFFSLLKSILRKDNVL